MDKMYDQDSPELLTSKTAKPEGITSFEGTPHGQIQKISQDGSKNTYVIILSKDYLKSESSKGHLLLQSLGNSKVDGNQKAKKFGKTEEKDFESPSGEVSAVRQKKLLEPPEDVKLNLSNIKDEEYDSNQSASRVFLQHDECSVTYDSAICLDTMSETSIMDSSNSQSNIFQQYKKLGVEQHAFKKTSPLKLCEQCPKQGLAVYNPAEPTTAKCIATVKHDPALKKAYSNVAVPVIGQQNKKSISILPKNGSKAVPTFSNISPISQKPMSQPHQSSFIPISPAESPASGAFPSGPFTSTPMTGEIQRRVQQVKHESGSHRSVYIIPSPFNKPSKCNSLAAQPQNLSHREMYSPVTQTPGFNNSSGFISGSSSLETPDASSSFEFEHGRQAERKISAMECREVYTEIHISDDRKSADTVCTASNEDMDDDIEELDLGFDVNSLDPSITSSQESQASEGTEKVCLNKSLTNIQWLKGMQLKEDNSSGTSSVQQQQNLQWTHLSQEEIKAISKDCGKNKRPPFSYCSLIQMALCSREDRKMMLKEICKWIEETFPYFHYTAKPGWRNSIRHNLSLYNIFEREPVKRHGSFWTLKSNVEPKTKQYHREKHSHVPSDAHRSMPTLPTQIPIIPVYSSRGQLSAVSPHTFSQSLQLPHNTACKKKGPPPILPRPTPYTVPQAYALIPIPSVNQTLSANSPSPAQQQVLLSLPGSGQMSACPSPIISEVSAAVASIQVSSASPVPTDQFCDTKALHNEHFYNKPKNIVKQAWINCQSMETTSLLDSPRSDLASSAEIASSEFTGRAAKSKRPRVRPGLPKPTIYNPEETKKQVTGSKRRKLQQKARSFSTENLDEDEDGVKFISNLEKEIFSRPSKSLEAEDVEHILTTSTPSKGFNHSSSNDLPSPIGRFTPLRGSGLFDNSFLETLGDRKALGLSPDSGERTKSPMGSPQLGDDPDDYLDFNVLTSLDGSPSQGNQNLSRILTEYGLDPAIDNADSFPHLNWSVVDQMVSNMDTTD